nr:MAG TPA: hypothetical protein [Caudoviricetes sp.]
MGPQSLPHTGLGLFLGCLQTIIPNKEMYSGIFMYEQEREHSHS